MSARNREQVYNTRLGLVLSSMCSEPILEHGLQAYKDNEHKHRSEAFDLMVMTVIFTTGIVSGCMPGDYNSIIAHAICYGCATMKKQKSIICTVNGGLWFVNSIYCR